MSEADKLFKEIGYDEKYYYKEGEVYEEVESYRDSKKCICIQFDIFNKTFCKFSQDDSEDDLETERIIIVESSATANSLPNATITRGDKVISGEQVIATGDIANMGGTKYTIVKKGDSTGDGYVKANDYLIIKDYIMETGTAKLEGAFKMAADVTGDSQVKENDYFKIKDHIMYGVEI